MKSISTYDVLHLGRSGGKQDNRIITMCVNQCKSGYYVRHYPLLEVLADKTPSHKLFDILEVMISTGDVDTVKSLISLLVEHQDRVLTMLRSCENPYEDQDEKSGLGLPQGFEESDCPQDMYDWDDDVFDTILDVMIRHDRADLIEYIDQNHPTLLVNMASQNYGRSVRLARHLGKTEIVKLIDNVK